MREFSQVRTVASRNSLYQILAIDVALGLGQRAKTWLSHTPIPLGAGLSEGDCYRELRRISLMSTSSAELRLIGFLRSSPLWSFQKFASGGRATSSCTSLNVTFAGA
jgi:hypothetical protein